jgi:hypothetical protein
LETLEIIAPTRSVQPESCKNKNLDSY